MIVRGIPSNPLPSHLGDEAKDLVRKMLCVDPAGRLPAAECLEHPWVTMKAPAAAKAKVRACGSRSRARATEESLLSGVP